MRTKFGGCLFVWETPRRKNRSSAEDFRWSPSPFLKHFFFFSHSVSPFSFAENQYHQRLFIFKPLSTFIFGKCSLFFFFGAYVWYNWRRQSRRLRAAEEERMRALGRPCIPPDGRTCLKLFPPSSTDASLIGSSLRTSSQSLTSSALVRESCLLKHVGD